MEIMSIIREDNNNHSIQIMKCNSFIIQYEITPIEWLFGGLDTPKHKKGGALSERSAYLVMGHTKYVDM